MSDLDEIYSRAWYEHDFAELAPEFDLAAKAIARMWEWTSVLDVGCGPGLLLAGLQKCGFRDLHGIDGSQHALDYAKARALPSLVTDRIRVVDVRSAESFSRYGLVISTEVAEHVEAEHAKHYVRFLCESATGPIIFTAAPPGQDGHHHVNCQPPEYWHDLFAEHGVIVDPHATRELRERWQRLARLAHMTRNVMVLH